MPNFAEMHDGGALIMVAPEGAFDSETITAAAGNDNSSVPGNIINRLVSGRNLFLSGKLVVPFKGVLAQAATLSAVLKLEDSASSTFATGNATLTPRRVTLRSVVAGVETVTDLTTLLVSGALPATVVATGGSGGTTQRGTIEADYDLAVARQYLRATRTLDLSAGSTDTVSSGGQLIFCGADTNPPA